jgi:mono/diheme cytochrome c family protein
MLCQHLRRVPKWILAFALVTFGSQAVVAQESPFKTPNGKESIDSQRLRSFVEKHCVKCHGGEKPMAGLSLDTFRSPKAILKERKLWDAALHLIESGEMPPAKQPQPTADEKAAFAKSVRAIFASSDTGKPDPGRILIRRLTRAEYGATVRDLLQLDLDFRPELELPSDAITHGFTNNAEALTISPVLLDSYLASAEMIAQRAILTKIPERKVLSATSSLIPQQKGFKGSVRLLDSGSKERHLLGPLRSPAPIGARARESLLRFAATDDFIFRAIVYGETSHTTPVRAALFIAGPGLPEYSTDDEIKQLMGEISHSDLQPMKILQTFEVTSRSAETPQQVEVLVSRNGRVGSIGSIGIALVKPPEDGQRVKLYVKLEAEGPLPSRSHAFLMNSSADKPQAEQTREIIGRLLPRAFRRPVTNGEIEAVARFADRAVADGQKWEVGMQHALTAMLCSPKFLFRAELDDRPSSAESHPIGEFELASRLSYFLWSSLPDDGLFKLAGEKKLSANLEAEVRRMLQNPRSKALVDNFAMKWLRLDALETHQVDAKLFPNFDKALREAMQQETQWFLHHMLREDRSLLELIDANYTFLNSRLAKHYRIADTLGNPVGAKVEKKGDPIPNGRFVRVSLQGNERGGLLSQASVLMTTSPSTRTSPVKRGAWVLENILGTPPPPPPPDVPELDQKETKVTTLRERLEQHRANVVCAGCHSKIDPLGFAFENYDAVGVFRTKEANKNIDVSGTLPDGRKINGMGDLKKALLADKEKFARHVAENMLTYALGRDIEYYDKRAIDRIVSEVAKDDFKFSRMVIAIVQSDPFRLRRGKDQAQ